MMKPFRSLFVATALCLLPASAHADVKVLASIKPVHSLVAGVMQGAGSPGLIVDGSASPHNYALKPSQAKALADAQIVFWIGSGLEGFLEKPLKNIAGKATAVSLAQAEGISHLGFRDLDEIGKEHDHAHDDDHGHKHGHGHSHGHDHASEDDPHIWLDPRNAAAMVTAIETALVKADPANTGTYSKNANAMRSRLGELETQIAKKVTPLKNARFVVFHDAYQYFERRFGLSASGAITLTPESTPGAQHVKEVSKRVKDLGVTCVFSEPQFEPKLVAVVSEGSKARSAELDPLGAALEAGPEHYFQLLTGMADSMSECLPGKS
jgi:zinc transport system substrate-binding protein